jgi:voltage-gated potassium channel
MLAGIALLGVITASVASWFIEKIAELTAAEGKAERVTLDHVLREVRELRMEVQNLQITTSAAKDVGLSD